VIPLASSDTILRNRNVLIVDNKIISINAGAPELKKYKPKTYIDGKSKYLIPGLADMHVHLENFESDKDLLLFLVNGVTHVRNMDGRSAILEWKDKALKKAMLSPVIKTAGPILEGGKPYWPDTKVVTNAEEAKAEVLLQKQQGYDFIKVYHTLDSSIYFTILESAKAASISVAGHLPGKVSLQLAIKNGHKCFEHLEGYDDYIEASTSPSYQKNTWYKPFFGFDIDTLKLKDAVALSKKYAVWNCPTLTVKSKIAPLDTLTVWLQTAKENHTPDYMLKAWSPDNFFWLKRMQERDWERVKSGKRHYSLLVRELYHNRGNIIAGTDTPNAFVVPGASLHEELLLLVEAGLSNYEALLCATANAARYYGEQNQWGKIQQGLSANLVILNANPLQDIRNSKTIYRVIVNGMLLDPEQLLQRYKK
jgi:imidazolonepropionase-like amidohydrolase